MKDMDRNEKAALDRFLTTEPEPESELISPEECGSATKLTLVLHLNVPSHYMNDDHNQMATEIVRYISRELPSGETVEDWEFINSD